jgi:hypothetical protein
VTPEELQTRRHRAILGWMGCLCASILLYAVVWDGPTPPRLLVSVCTLGLVVSGAALSSLRGKGLLSAYGNRLSVAERAELDRINKRSWPGFFGMIAAVGAMMIARSAHDHLAPYYRPVILVLVAVTVLLGLGQFSLKRAERRVYDRVLP